MPIFLRSNERREQRSERMTTERQAGVHWQGWGEQLLPHITGDIIYLQYSTTAHLLSTHQQTLSNLHVPLPSLLERFFLIWFSLESLRNPLKTLQLCLQSAFLLFCIISPAPLFTRLTIALKTQSSAFILLVPPLYLHLSSCSAGAELIHLSLCCLIPYKPTPVTIILCSCSILPQNWQF